MGHWRTWMESEYFCSADLWDEANEKYRNVIVKIVKVAKGQVRGDKGRKKSTAFLWFEFEDGTPARAPFGSNSTNNTTIETVTGQGDPKRWPGCWIGLYVTKVDSPNGPVPAIRVHPKPVQPRIGQKSTPPAASSPPADGSELSEADKRAIELAEAEEASRAR